MDVLTILRNCAEIAQKSNDIPLVQNIIEAQQQILDQQEEISNLKAQIKELQQLQDISSRIERHTDPYITLSGDSQKIIYCSACWDSQRKLVQVQARGDGCYQCNVCKTSSYYNRALFDSKHNQVISTYPFSR